MNELQTQSQTISELAKALSKAQGEMSPAMKDCINPFFKSHYASLESCIDAARKCLQSNGLSVSQPTQPIGSQLYVVTTLMHTSGEWVRGYFPVLAKDSSPQAVGSGTSYARRFAFSAIINQATSDDDANTAQDTQNINDAPEMPRISKNTVSYNERHDKKMTEPATEPQRKKLFAMTKALGWSDQEGKDWIFEKWGKESSKELSKSEIQNAFQLLESYASESQETIQRG